MPLYFQKQLAKSSKLCVWKITETLEELKEMYNHPEDAINTPVKSTRKQLEDLTVRMLLSKMVENPAVPVEIVKDPYGKPHLKNHPVNISISHTKNFVAVIISADFRVGVDIERITPRIENLSTRFVSDKEKSWLKQDYLPEQLYIIWGAKECAYKIYSHGGIDFKKMLEVESFNYSSSGETKVRLKKNKITTPYPVFWETLGDVMLVYASGSNLTVFQN